MTDCNFDPLVSSLIEINPEGSALYLRTDGHVENKTCDY
jgi:hypothetical protein